MQSGDPAVDGLKVYVVGGAVRDRLLGRKGSDRDWVVVGSTPDEMLSRGFQQVGRDFPVFLHPHTHEEYALARTERKRGRGHRGFTCDASPDVSLEADLARRDLTINAMAEDADGHVVDPFGGVADLRARCLRHVSPAFAEDPLRVFRVARFAAVLGFSTAPETLDLMTSMARSGELLALSAERVWQETAKALYGAHPYEYFALLARCDALVGWFHELAAAWSSDLAMDPLPANSAQMALAPPAQINAALKRAVTCADPLAVRAAIVLAMPDIAASARLLERLRPPNQVRDVVQMTGTLAPLVERAIGRGIGSGTQTDMHRDGADALASENDAWGARLDARISLLLDHDGIRRPGRLADSITACGRRAGQEVDSLLAWMEDARERLGRLDLASIARNAGDRRDIPGLIREAQVAALRD